MIPDIDWSAAADEATTHFKALLRFDTTNPPGNEEPAAQHIAGVLSREGIEHQVIVTAPGRACVVARLRGTGVAGPLLLNGHLDVVPVDRAAWKHDPFAAEEHEGCIWGRGTIDMKNMVAMSLMTMLLLHRSGRKLSRDLIFAAVADEEAGSRLGALHLVENHPELVRADYVLNEVGGHTLTMGDARFYPIQVAEKGICWFELTAKGQPGHGSMPHAHNAVVKLARALEAIGRTRLPQHNLPIVEQFLRTISRGGPLAQRAVFPLLLEPRLAGHLLGILEKQRPDDAMGINAMLRHTVSPTMLSAGQKVNVIPSTATAKLDGRVLPGYSVEQFLAEVQAVIGDELQITVFEQHDGVVFPAQTPLFDEIVRALAEHDPGATAVPYMIPGFTDSFAYARLGAVCYGFSPVRLGPELKFTRMYHGHDERIPIDGFRWGLRVLHDVVQRFVAPG